MPALSRLARKRWYIFKHANPATAADPRASFVVAYMLGWRECVSGSAAFAGLPEQLHRLSDLLEDTQQWQAAVDIAVEGEEVTSAEEEPLPS